MPRLPHMRFLLAALLAAACMPGLESDSGSADSGQPAPSGDAQSWLDLQNAVRAKPSPAPSSPLPALTWSSGAAAVAQAWADGCSYQHNAGRGDRGENIAASAPPGHWGISNVVDAWASEASHYDYSSNSCAAGEQCGHYTQIVWRGTLRAGCAHRVCTANSPFGAQL